VENGVATRIIVGPIGSALPLGFFAFGIGMFMLAGQRIGWIRPYEIHDIGLILVAFVAPLEFLATVMAFSHAIRSGRRRWASFPAPGS
jgi:uncharacterized protein